MSKFKRRDFLKLTAAGLTLPSLLPGAVLANEKQSSVEPIKLAADGIPAVATTRSVVMRHKFGDLFNPPGLTNQWGCAQAAMDVVAVRSIAFPPFAQGEMNVAPLGSGGELLTAVLYVD